MVFGRPFCLSCWVEPGSYWHNVLEGRRVDLVDRGAMPPVTVAHRHAAPKVLDDDSVIQSKRPDPTRELFDTIEAVTKQCLPGTHNCERKRELGRVILPSVVRDSRHWTCALPANKGKHFRTSICE